MLIVYCQDASVSTKASLFTQLNETPTQTTREETDIQLASWIHPWPVCIGGCGQKFFPSLPLPAL